MIRDTDSPHVARDVARRVRRGRRALVVKSMKCPGGDLRLESGLERDVSLMLDLDPRIIEITAQPFTLELQSNKLLPSRQHYLKRPGIKPRFYTPDFLCKFDDGSLIAIDAKHSKFVEEFELKRNAIVLGLRQHGIGFSVILDTAVCPVVMSTVASLHLLRAAYLEPVRSAAERELSGLIGACDHWLTEELVARLNSGRVGVMVGLLSGLLSADFSLPLFSQTSQVRAAYGDLSHLQFLEVCV